MKINLVNNDITLLIRGVYGQIVKKKITDKAVTKSCITEILEYSITKESYYRA